MIVDFFYSLRILTIFLLYLLLLSDSSGMYNVGHDRSPAVRARQQLWWRWWPHPNLTPRTPNFGEIHFIHSFIHKETAFIPFHSIPFLVTRNLRSTKFCCSSLLSSITTKIINSEKRRIQSNWIRNERNHKHTYRSGRDSGRQFLLGALLPRTRHSAWWNDAKVFFVYFSFVFLGNRIFDLDLCFALNAAKL